MDLGNAIGALAGTIMIAGLLSVLFYGFEVHKYPKKWDEDLENTYVMELIKKSDNYQPDNKGGGTK